MKRKISFPNLPISEPLMDLFCEQSEQGRHFWQFIRSYNHNFAFTLMGVHVDDNNEIEHRLSESRDLPAHIVQRVKTILDQENPFVKEFRQLAQREDLHQCKLIIKEQHPNQPQYCLPTASQVAAVAVGVDEARQLYGRNILVETIYGQPITIPDVAGYYDPLQYPLLFPFGTYGWDINTTCANNNTVTCREFYAYRFQIHLRPISTLLHEGRLLQQYGVDMHVKIESHKLRWIQQNQEALWAKQYQGLQDAFQAGENYTGNVHLYCAI
ncbi:hypothetical protein CMV_009763 [Castanea mollissima]|uniref:Helitron helicase-like domain-containing protein n=1 Tax=Castanea mollissima TaxID=60419 RepID=A0A8J4VYD0_9ROSI|nr:hypothetical protein CMV_009763 [Castanea mollissima]